MLLRRTQLILGKERYMKIIKVINEKLEFSLLVLLSIVTVVVVFAQVVCRLTAGSLPWSEELARYCFIWMVCIGTSYAVKCDKLTKVDLIVNLLGDKQKRVVSAMVNLLVVVFSAVVVYYGMAAVAKMLAFGQTSPALKIPKGYIYFAAPFGFGLAGIRAIQNIVTDILVWIKENRLKERDSL